MRHDYHLQYDVIGARFEESKNTAAFSAADTHTLLTVLDQLGGVKGLDVLDLACGYGHNTRLLARAGARRTVGVDTSAEMIRLARAYAEGPEGPEGLQGLQGLQGLEGLDVPAGLDGPVREADRAGGTAGAEADGVRGAEAIEYVTADVAELPPLGAFDLATAVYLFNDAEDRNALHAMFRAIRTSLRPGGRLLAIVPNPGAFPHADWSPFGVRILERIPEGDAPLLRLSFLTDPPVPFTCREWPHQEFAEAAVEAGFASVSWQPSRTPPPDRERDEAFWTAYRATPVSSLMICTA
ncbi:class I SAM-dependent methyltransferase [Streptomyces sp. NPDC048603]|uniref:class I SAM-dependent methyltransferase n=1 Tax=Streptomyces sp. NPDC048603 TaxID=3365577 RepID=UPI00371C2254